MTQHSSEMGSMGHVERTSLIGKSVANKIAFGFGVVLLLHLSIIVLQHYGLKQADAGNRTQVALLNQVEAFSEIDRVVGELERNLLLFTFGGYRGPEQRVVSLQNQLEELLLRVDTMDIGTAIEIDRPSIQLMREHLGQHRDIFASAVTDREKRYQLIEGELTRLAFKFDTLTQQLVATELSQWDSLSAELAFRHAQLKAMQFVHDPDSSYVRLVKSSLGSSRDSIRHLSISAPDTSEKDVQALLDVVDQYDRAFMQMVQATRNYLHMVNVVLAGETEEFLYLASNARDTYSRRAETLAQSMQRDSQVFRHACNLFSVLTVVLGLIATWLIRRDVVPPLKAITETLDGLSKGKTCELIPGLGRSDELGKLASAAQFFKNKAAETERLLAEVTRMKELERQHSHDQKMESLGQLAAGIAHEINTPMQCVASNVEYIEESFGVVLQAINALRRSFSQNDLQNLESLEELKSLVGTRRFQSASIDIPDAVKDASGAVLKVIEIVRAMKMMSHPGRVKSTPTDMNQLVQDAAVISRSRWKYVAEMKLELEPSIPLLDCMGAELSQVILNLIVNAADAISEKRHEGEPLGAITVRTAMSEGNFELKVIDTGAGIPKELEQKIFEPFFTTKDVGAGTGQGLAICYEVVKRHQGTMQVESKLGDGTTFTVTLPTERVPAAVFCAEPGLLTS